MRELWKVTGQMASERVQCRGRLLIVSIWLLAMAAACAGDPPEATSVTEAE